KEKQKFLFDANTIHFWSLFQKKIKEEFKDKLDSISEMSIELISTKFDISIKGKTDFKMLFATISENPDGPKSIAFKLKCSQLEFFSYKCLSQIERVFGISVERIIELLLLRLSST
ncbi:16959_t:CDS:2, partial [Racocetra persica]